MGFIVPKTGISGDLLAKVDSVELHDFIPVLV
jgi:hypothetical protein